MNLTVADCIAHVCVYVCLSVCLQPYTINFKLTHLNILEGWMSSCPYTAQLECSIGSGGFMGGRAGSWEELEHPSQTFFTPPPGICWMILLISSYLELDHMRTTWKAQWRGRRVYIVSSSDQLSGIEFNWLIAVQPISEDLESKKFSGAICPYSHLTC